MVIDPRIKVASKLDKQKQKNQHDQAFNSVEDDKNKDSKQNNYTTNEENFSKKIDTEQSKIIEIHYNVNKSSSKIRLFGHIFFEKYKNQKELFSLNINSVQNELVEFFEFSKRDKHYKVLVIYLIIKKNAEDLSYMFAECHELNYIVGLENLMNESVTNYSNFFLNCSSLKIINNLKECNMESVTDMNSMFRGCTKLENILGISKWKTNKVTNMASMFYACENLIELKLDEWNTNNVIYF